LEHLIDGISNQRWQGLHELYAHDTLVEYPFALPAPARLEGREAVQRYFAAVARMPLELRARNIVVHETSNPQVIVAEWDYDGLVTTTNRAFHVANIQVSTVRNGQIVASRDYHNQSRPGRRTWPAPRALRGVRQGGAGLTGRVSCPDPVASPRAPGKRRYSARAGPGVVIELAAWSLRSSGRGGNVAPPPARRHTHNGFFP
jgi:ketosteroid isomerase-like protein